MLTLPSTSTGTALVQPAGVKINNVYYWTDSFRHPDLLHTPVPVRYDPFNMGVAYAYVKGRWTQCLSEHYAILKNRSEREVLIASRELHKRKQGYSQRTGITARRLADFLASAEAEEVLLKQRLRDAEVRNKTRQAEVGLEPPTSLPVTTIAQKPPDSATPPTQEKVSAGSAPETEKGPGKSGRQHGKPPVSNKLTVYEDF
jgi:putative transposase